MKVIEELSNEELVEMVKEISDLKEKTKKIVEDLEERRKKYE